MQCLLLLLSMLVGHWLIAALCCVHLATPVCALLLVLLRKYLLNVYTLRPITVYNEQRHISNVRCDACRTASNQ
jgi:predicted membrane metal-binding protein